ncbi:MAG: superoxide dismutase [bacterium]|nr:superoxide dismutase [bacterium]
MKYTLPSLSYGYDALEPYIDAKTMEIHHSKHHQAYIDKLNLVLEKNPTIADKPLEELMKNLASLSIDEKDKTMLRNHGGGHLNHSFFWKIMGKEKKVNKELVERITKKFGSMEEFKKIFTETAVGRFGSGWAWLVEDEKKELKVYSTANQDSPYLSGHTPIIGLDVWEHAYYLKYQNKRPDYIQNWWNVLTLI